MWKTPKFELPFLKKKLSAQSMVEFALVLPVLLALIFGIIEFGRLFQAWLSVQNSARFAVRYAVTGNYDFGYCDDAGIALVGEDAFTKYETNNIVSAVDPVYADTYGGDPQDCKIPNAFQTDLRGRAPFSGMAGNAQQLAVSEAIQNMTATLQDYARLNSIHDITEKDAFAIAMDPTVHDEHELGYFNVIVYSSRLIANGGSVTFSDPANNVYWGVSPNEDPGGPSDRVAIGVDFNHPLITPFLMSVWPYVHLTTVREGIIENFRSSKTINVAPPISMPTPTASFTPSITPSPTSTFTLTPTNTHTPTPSLTPSNTATATSTYTPSVTSTPTFTQTPSRTPTQTRTPSLTPTISCGNLSMTLGLDGTNVYRLRATIRNNNSAAIGFGTTRVTWNKSQPSQALYRMTFMGTRFYNTTDYTSPTDGTYSPEVMMAGGSTDNRLIIYFNGLDSRGLDGTFTVNVSLDEGRCPLTATYTRTAATATNTRTPTRTFTASTTPTITRTPTITLTPSITPTPSRTNTRTPTFTRTPSRTPTITYTPSRTPTRTLTPTRSPTPTASRTPTRTPTPTRSPTPTQAPTNTPTRTPTPTYTYTPRGCGSDC